MVKTFIDTDLIKSKPVCSPYANKNKILPNSCFTPQTLIKLRDMYNINTTNKITTDNPREIWKLLHKYKPQNCQKDKCWIQSIIHDNTTKIKLEALLFPPTYPEEWKKNPNTWLSNFDILDVLKQYEQTYSHFVFIGPSPIDFDVIQNDKSCVCNNLCHFSLNDIRKKHVTKIGIIFNLDPHTSSGSHWVSLFIDLQDHFIFYFDSTGDLIPSQIRKFVRTVVLQNKILGLSKLTFYQNDEMEHQLGNTECGMYSLYFIISMLLREKSDGTKMTKKEVISLFLGKHGRIRDKQVESLRTVYFSSGGSKKKRKHQKNILSRKSISRKNISRKNRNKTKV